ncbi:hypothetical protein PG997_008703, partial [Apiospora hydei]
MTDITPLFDGFLAQHKASRAKRAFNVDSLDEFVKEAYTIYRAITSLHTDLRSIRQRYLSTAPPRRTLIHSAQHDRQSRPLTDREREDIDANSKNLLRQLNASIRELSDAENTRREMEAALIGKKFGRGLGALGAWAAGGGKNQQNRGARHGGRQGEYAEHAPRERALDTATAATRVRQDAAGHDGGYIIKHGEPGGMPESPGKERRKQSQSLLPGQQPSHDAAQDLSPEQIQMFEKENHDMLKHYESTLDQVRTAEKSLIEISELQTQLVNNLATQSAHIDQLVTDSFNTAENVGRGNTQLKKATQRPSMA